ncbi:MAG: DUF1015 domain-containing protein [Candidatus Dormibacteraeota bacterium]|nr:DUF1015 domain-containing protein [Candidatus Dormibacteraeota bacterium]
MADVSPLRGIRFDPAVVDMGVVLAPPYDVISSPQQDVLYARDLRNIVRIDYGRVLDDDVAGSSDRYTRAAEHLGSWLRVGVLRRERQPAYYVTTQEFLMPDGAPQIRRGLLARVRAAPWAASDLLPHERTLRGPKEDRLALMRATNTQTSPVFALWQGAEGLVPLLDAVTARPPDATAVSDGELGPETHRLWVVDDSREVSAIGAALAPSRLFVADGHHRYETAAAYAAERRAAEPDAPPDADFEFCLVSVSDAADPGIALLPTHRLLLPRHDAAFSLDDLWMRLSDQWEMEPAADLDSAIATAAGRRETDHAFATVGPDGTAVLFRPRDPHASARAALDVVVLQDEVLGPAGVDEEAIRSGALGYTREPSEVARAVGSGEALLGFCINPATTAEMIAVAEAGEVMPQKSTYFYPKVPTGLVLSPA